MRQSSLLRYFALFCLDRLLRVGIHPPSVDAQTVFRCGLRTTELVPIRHPERSEMELRDHVVAVLQDAVERPRVGDEARPVRRPDQLFNHLVDDRALDAENIATSRLVGNWRTEKFALLVTGRQRLREQRYRHVEIKGFHPFFILRDIDSTDPGGYPHAFEVLREG